MIRAIAYMRLSADEKHTGSISFSVQADHIEKLAKDISATIVENVQDNAISGAVPFKKRPGGRRTQALIENGSINAIIALRQERLFRDTREALEYVDLWKQQGVTVYFAEDGGAALDASSPSGRMIFTMKAAVASYERDQTALRVRENKAARKLQNKTYSPTRYGYDQVDGYDVPNLTEMAVIKEIFRMRGEGAPLREIAGKITGGGYPTKRNKAKWSAQIINDILTRPNPTDGLALPEISFVAAPRPEKEDKDAK
jgi:DNA invertase Pin-like site-specific DNA recombinase